MRREKDDSLRQQNAQKEELSNETPKYSFPDCISPSRAAVTLTE